MVVRKTKKTERRQSSIIRDSELGTLFEGSEHETLGRGTLHKKDNPNLLCRLRNCSDVLGWIRPGTEEEVEVKQDGRVGLE